MCLLGFSGRIVDKELIVVARVFWWYFRRFIINPSEKKSS